MRVFGTLGKRKAVLGMVHLPPLPGTPFYEDGSFASTLEIAVGLGPRAGRGRRRWLPGADRGPGVSTGEESDPARTAAVALIVSAIAQRPGRNSRSGCS